MKSILIQFYIDFKTINFLMHNVNTARTRLWAFWVDITKCLRINNLITVNSKKSWNSCIFSQARIKKKHFRPPVLDETNVKEKSNVKLIRASVITLS